LANATEGFSLSLIPGNEVIKLPQLREEWGNLLSSSENLDLLYQSPQWCEHLLAADSKNSQLLLGVAKNKVGSVVGVVPIRVGQYNLRFDISSYALWKTTLRTASILGSQPLLPNDDYIFDCLFASLWSNLRECDCIYMDSVPTNSFLWQYLGKSGENRRNDILYVPDGARPYHSLLLPATFAEYLSSFKRKKRYNLERQVKMLRDHGGGVLDMMRVDSESQIQGFLEGAVWVARNSWQQTRIGTRIDNSPQRHAKLADLAERGLLRSYLLICGEKPCAFILGYQFRDVYHYVEIAYDQSFTKFSPGTVLLYLLIEDLIRHNAPQKVNFGIGHASYKQEFSNIHNEDASVLLLRKTIANRIRMISHSSFRSLIHAVKKRIKEKD
jgi:hypothetical protein